MKLIDKDALVAEIKKYYEEYLKRAKIYVYDANYWIGKADAYHSMLETIDTFEVKEVDLSKEIDNYFDNYKFAEKEECWLNHDQVYIFAKYFFELGLKVQKGE